MKGGKHIFKPEKERCFLEVMMSLHLGALRFCGKEKGWLLFLLDTDQWWVASFLARHPKWKA